MSNLIYVESGWILRISACLSIWSTFVNLIYSSETRQLLLKLVVLLGIKSGSSPQMTDCETEYVDP